MIKLNVVVCALGIFIFSGARAQGDCNLNKPVLNQISVTACEISLSWEKDSLAHHYEVRYTDDQSQWQSSVNVGISTSYTFAGLQPNTQYIIQVKPYCNPNDSGITLTLIEITPSCSPPGSITATNISDDAATITWQLCGGGIASRVRFRESGSPGWQNAMGGSDSSQLLSGLKKSTLYEYELNTCNNISGWSPAATFKTLDSSLWRPNILCIFLDDSRYDPFAPNGGPSFFQSPGINRIADEGVRFVYAFPALSLCSPSRASIMTGLYPHHHGVISNVDPATFPYPTVAQILHDNGYYTGFVGKYAFQKIIKVTGFDYYLESSNNVYWDSDYDYNGQLNIVIPGHKTDVITSKALEFLNSVPVGKRFLLYVAHKAPHVPYTPRPQDSGIYQNDPMPFPGNFEMWTQNVLSSYNSCYANSNDTGKVYNQLEDYYELLAGAEASIDTILTYLAETGILDSTLVIFSSDNGLLIGEHLLSGKEIALEESIRLPMFIRYPKWFAPGTVVTNEMAMNIDIAPTMLEAAGIPDTFGMDGLSMLGLVNHTAHRKELLYEYFYNESCNPTLACVRDFSYKYISNRCSGVAEEFYDLVNDPGENLNLINALNMSSIIQKYRDKLDSLKQVYGYVLVEDTILPCSLENTSCTGDCDISATKNVTSISGSNLCNDGKIKITPSGNFTSYLHLELYDHDNSLISSVDPESTTDPYTFKNLHAGKYFVKVFDYCCEVDLEDIEVKCPKPTGLFTSGITANSVTVNWANQGCNKGYKLQYRKLGTSSWITLKPSTNMSSFIITNLIQNMIYEWRVAAKCADANPATNSKYSSLQTFTTSLRLGESQYEEKSGVLLLYPNPTSEMITVELRESDVQFIQLEDPLGRILMTEKSNGEYSKHLLHVASLPGGIYLVTVKTPSGILKKSFVKY